MSTDQIISIAGLLLACVGACVGGYVAIRVDMAKTRERAEWALGRANTAHDRIDNLMRQA